MRKKGKEVINSFEICDVCGSNDNVSCEVYTNGESIKRIYHFCSLCQVELYRQCIDDLIGNNDYKVAEFIQRYADSMICESMMDRKLGSVTDNECDLFDIFNPKRIRKCKPYSDDEYYEEINDEHI